MYEIIVWRMESVRVGQVLINQYARACLDIIGAGCHDFRHGRHQFFNRPG